MKLPIAIAALFLAATTTLPTLATAQTGQSSYQKRQQAYRAGANAYAQAPAPRTNRPAASSRNRPATNNSEHCVSGLASEAYSAYPAWEMCQNR